MIDYNRIPIASQETVRVGDIYFGDMIEIVTEVSEEIFGVYREYLRYNQEQKRNNPVAKGIFLRERDGNLEIVAVTNEFLKGLKIL